MIQRKKRETNQFRLLSLIPSDYYIEYDNLWQIFSPTFEINPFTHAFWDLAAGGYIDIRPSKKHYLEVVRTEKCY